jgi:hypothetical protein
MERSSWKMIAIGKAEIGDLPAILDLQHDAYMNAVENHYSDVNRAELFTGHKSTKNLAFYERLGYTKFKEKVMNHNLTVIYLGKDI